MPGISPPQVQRSPGERQRWLLVYNCQVLGLANCLNLMCADIEVESYDRAAFQRHSTLLLQRSGEFDRVLVSPNLESNLAIDRTQFQGFWSIPTIHFDAYHPDLCHLVVDGQPLKGPMGDYHSLIAYMAFQCGMNTQQTLRLYRDDVYSALGYYGFWDRAREALLRSFRNSGIVLDDRFANWSRNRPFMYSNNHPLIHAIRDVARGILESAGLEASYKDAIPQDNLANAPIYPVYPEIASMLGVDGSYRFKPAGYNGFMTLEDFVAGSRALYRDANPSIHPLHRSIFNRALPILAEMR